jgi:hypothetical protein
MSESEKLRTDRFVPNRTWLTILFVMYLRRDTQAQAVEANETGSVVLVVGFGRVGFHGGNGRVVKAHGGFAAGDHDVAFVKFHADGTGDVFLTLSDEGLQCEAFWREPVAVIHEFGVARNQRIAEMHDFAIHRERFHLPMGEVQDCAARGFIDAAGFHSYVSVFDEVHAADGMLAAEFIQRPHDAERIHGFAVDGDAIAFFEIEGDVFGFVRRVFRIDAEFEHRFILRRKGIEPGVFENAGFEGDVKEVSIHRIRFFRGRFHRDPFLVAISDHFGAAGEGIAEPRFAPGRNNLKFWRERGGREFEADLVVAFAGCAVGEGIGFFFAGDIDHAFGDQWTGNAGAEEVLVLINCAGLNHRIDEVTREFLLQVSDVDFGGAGAFGFLLEAFEFFLLADVGAEGDHLRGIVFSDPGEQHGRIETAGVSQNNLHPPQLR